MTEPMDTGEGEGTVDVAALPDIPSRVYAFGLPEAITADEEHVREFTDAITGLFDKADVVVFDREMDPHEPDDAIEVHTLDEEDIYDIVGGGEDV